MTTIAYRDGVLAADTAVFDRDVYCGQVTKIHRAPTGALLAAAGALGDMMMFKNWALAGAEDPRPEFTDEDSEGLLIQPDGKVFWYGKTQHSEIVGDFHAIGSGFRVAMGAMAAGASAIRAVEICADLDNCTRRPLQSLRLQQLELLRVDLS